jgi:hypothetical protein
MSFHKSFLLLIMSLSGIYTMTCQNFKIDKIIVDKVSKFPLENVSIYNDKDNSMSNSDGIFIFMSSKNEIHFNLLGYNPVVTTFNELSKQDTIFLEPKALELKEVIVTNVDSYMKKVFDLMSNNIISNYTTDFFLRNVLKKNDSIVKLQDVFGKKTFLPNQKRDLLIEVLNMRKIGILERNTVDLKFPDFNEFFNPPFTTLEISYFTEEDYNDKDYKKISFEEKVKDPSGQTHKGYFIINRKDYAIVEYFISMYDNLEAGPYHKIPFYGTQYRTIKYERRIRLAKNAALNKYYLADSKLNSRVEILADKRIEKTFYYNLTMDYFTTGSPTNEAVNSNFSVDKDIFKAKFPYSADFWNNQNQLPLTQELKNFLKRVAENKDKKKEYEIIGNF